MVSAVIVALSGTASIGTAGLMDALNKADLAGRLEAGRGAPGRVFDVRLAGLDDGLVSCRDGVILQPSVTAGNVSAPDLVVVPGLDDELAASTWVLPSRVSVPLSAIWKRETLSDAVFTVNRNWPSWVISTQQGAICWSPNGEVPIEVSVPLK
jgi:hypothetical protein